MRGAIDYVEDEEDEKHRRTSACSLIGSVGERSMHEAWWGYQHADRAKKRPNV